MSQITRMHPDCPPDAHKVFREPENKLNAILAVQLKDSEINTYGNTDTAEVLALMSSAPNVICSAEAATVLTAAAASAEIKPNLVRVNGEEACLIYPDGAHGQELKFYNFANDYNKFSSYLQHLSEKCIISVDTLSMLILRSISTVYPWDQLLAGDFVRQYLKARAALTADDITLLTDIRYGRHSSEIKEKFPAAYQFLRLERKLFLQYPSDD